MADVTTIKSLNHFNNANLTDEIGNFTWSCNSDASFVSGYSNSKFGKGCIYIPERTSRVTAINQNGSLSLGNSNTINEFEFFIKITADIEEGLRQLLISFGNEDYDEIISVVVRASDDLWKTSLTNANTGITPNEWTHVLIRFSCDQKVYTFINGVLADSADHNYVEEVTEYYDANTLSSIDIIKFKSMQGYIDEFIHREIVIDTELTSAEDYDGTHTPTVPTGPYSTTGEITEDVREYEAPGVVKETGGGALQLRGGTRAILSEANPILARREIMVEVDTGKIKVGDGTTKWNGLGYSGVSNEPNVKYARGFLNGNTTWVWLEESVNSGFFTDNQISIIVDSLEGIEGTIFEGIPLNSIITLMDGNFDVYVPKNSDICIVGKALDGNGYLVYRYDKSNDVWEEMQQY